MRVLFEHEMYGVGTLSGMSMFTDYCGLLKGCLDNGYKIKPYFVTPRTREQIVWDDAEITSAGFIPVSAGVEKINAYDYQVVRPEVIELLRDTNFILDAFVTNSSTQVALMKLMQRSSKDRWLIPLEIPIIARLSESTTDSNIKPLAFPCGGGLVALGATECMTLAMTKLECSEMSALSRKYLSPSMWTKVSKHVQYLQAAFDSTEIDTRFPEYEAQRVERLRSGQVNVYHAGTLHSARRVNELIALAAKVRAHGVNLHLHLLTQNPSGFPCDEAWVHTKGGCKRPDVLKELGQGDLCWMATDYEGTGLAYMEACYSGMLPICADVPWVNERISKEYPIRLRGFNSTDSLKVFLYACRNVLKLREEWQARILEDVRPWTHQAAGKRFYELVEGYVASEDARQSPMLEKAFPHQFLVAARSKLGERVTLLEAITKASECTKEGVDFRWFGARATRKVLMSFGYLDTLQGDGWETVMEFGGPK